MSRETDRVGVIRKLKLGYTLRNVPKSKKVPSGWIIDLTDSAFRHKTSRFFGPTITQVSVHVVKHLEDHLVALNYKNFQVENHYVFQQGNVGKNISIPNWTRRVKDAFERHSPRNTATPPKLLRSSFITFLRSEKRAPEVLKSAAATMKHSVDTQSSDVYDIETHDNLTKAAAAFCEEYAMRYEKEKPKNKRKKAVDLDLTGGKKKKRKRKGKEKAVLADHKDDTDDTDDTDDKEGETTNKGKKEAEKQAAESARLALTTNGAKVFGLFNMIHEDGTSSVKEFEGVVRAHSDGKDAGAPAGFKPAKRDWFYVEYSDGGKEVQLFSSALYGKKRAGGWHTRSFNDV